jgi:hypothetical protein
MPQVLKYVAYNVHPDELPRVRQNLRLMLWAGDGDREGLTDVARLQGYDVYLCMGISREGLERNIADLSGSQILCIIDVTNKNQMNEFIKGFGGAFIHIDSDYRGNTPTLPLNDYAALLGPGGVAHNIEGINSLIMPEEELLDVTELFAPVIDLDARARRIWSRAIIDLGKRDDLLPSHVWSSPDLKHPFYDNTRQQQQEFVRFQKERNGAWPSIQETLQAQWDILSIRILTANINRVALPIEQKHLEEFSNFLSEKIMTILSSKPEFTLVQSALEEACYGKDLRELIRIKQQVLKDVTLYLPANITGVIGRYLDERMATRPTLFGISLIRSI